MVKLRSLDLFSGVGGFALGMMPFAKPVAYCDIDDTAIEVLKRRMQSGDLHSAPIFNDVCEISSKDVSKVDLITAGFPCPDVSKAGKGGGIDGGTQTILVYEVIRLIKELNPSYVLLENVASITNDKQFPSILSKLSKLGYDWSYDFYSAASLGGAHTRDRWFLLAMRRLLPLAPVPSSSSRDAFLKTLLKLLKPRLSSAGCDSTSSPKSCPLVPQRYHKLYGNALVPAAAHLAFTELLARLKSQNSEEIGVQIESSSPNWKNAITLRGRTMYKQRRRLIGQCCGNEGNPWLIVPNIDRSDGKEPRNKLPILTKPFTRMCLPTPRASIDNGAGGHITERSARTLGRFVMRTSLCKSHLRGKKTTRMQLPFLENLMGFPSGWTLRDGRCRKRNL
jgi:DNA-cytosine methyltransferase